jgi:hypothetical protein
VTPVFPRLSLLSLSVHLNQGTTIAEQCTQHMSLEVCSTSSSHVAASTSLELLPTKPVCETSYYSSSLPAPANRLLQCQPPSGASAEISASPNFAPLSRCLACAVAISKTVLGVDDLAPLYDDVMIEVLDARVPTCVVTCRRRSSDSWYDRG